jgi:hypothetical protein
VAHSVRAHRAERHLAPARSTSTAGNDLAADPA